MALEHISKAVKRCPKKLRHHWHRAVLEDLKAVFESQMDVDFDADLSCQMKAINYLLVAYQEVMR